MSRAGLLLAAAFTATLVLALREGASVRGVAAEQPQAGETGSATGAAGPLFVDVVARSNPAVVQVTTLDRGLVRDPNEEESQGAEPGVPRRGDGSGFLISESGEVLTNHHLIADAERIYVRLADRRQFPARLFGSDASTDVALLKIEGSDLPFIPLGDSKKLRPGEWVCAIGNPLRFDNSVTVGVVSSMGRKIFDATFDQYIQTDAAINPGNSGGPLLNLAGEAVGINSAVSREGQGIGFAVPINLVKEELRALKEHGHVLRGYLGIELRDVEPGMLGLLKLNDAAGALVLEVEPGRAGQQAGLRRYDVIRRIAGQAVRDGDSLVRQIAARRPGSVIDIELLRDGSPLKLSAQLEERQETLSQAEAPRPRTPPHRVDGLGLRVLDPATRQRRRLSMLGRKGVVIADVLDLSPGAEDLDLGDVVVEINRQPTVDVQTYKQIVAGLTPGETAWLYVYRPKPGVSFLAALEVRAPRGER